MSECCCGASVEPTSIDDCCGVIVGPTLSECCGATVGPTLSVGCGASIQPTSNSSFVRSLLVRYCGLSPKEKKEPYNTDSWGLARVSVLECMFLRADGAESTMI